MFSKRKKRRLKKNDEIKFPTFFSSAYLVLLALVDVLLASHSTATNTNAITTSSSSKSPVKVVMRKSLSISCCYCSISSSNRNSCFSFCTRAHALSKKGDRESLHREFYRAGTHTVRERERESLRITLFGVPHHRRATVPNGTAAPESEGALTAGKHCDLKRRTSNL